MKTTLKEGNINIIKFRTLIFIDSSRKRHIQYISLRSSAGLSCSLYYLYLKRFLITGLTSSNSASEYNKLANDFNCVSDLSS